MSKYIYQPSSEEVILTFKFYFMYLGFTGSPSLKSKADALKYAIEFTATGEYPNRAPDIKKAKELYNFICENVQLPDDNIDNNRLYTQRSLDEILLHTNACLNDFLEYTRKDRRKCNPEKPRSSGEVVEEQNEEEAIPLPGSSPLSPVANNLRSILRDNKFESICAAGASHFSRETFRLNGNGEYLDVTIIHSSCPKKE